jgi:hypothetical protein
MEENARFLGRPSTSEAAASRMFDQRPQGVAVDNPTALFRSSAMVPGA